LPWFARTERARGKSVATKGVNVITKLAIIVGGVVLMAGVALAGTLTSLGSSGNPAGQTIAPVSSTTGTQSDDGAQGVETETAENEAENENEDLRGPCDEAEHANDPRCTGAATTRDDDRGLDDRGEDRHGDRSGHDGPGRGPEDD
jgi:hypothetical protein